MSDLPVIHHCPKLVNVPGNIDLILYTPHLQLKSTENPVHQVVKAALFEHAAKKRPAPREVWVWGSYVYVPADQPEEGEDGEN